MGLIVKPIPPNTKNSYEYDTSDWCLVSGSVFAEKSKPERNPLRALSEKDILSNELGKYGTENPNTNNAII